MLIDTVKIERVFTREFTLHNRRGTEAVLAETRFSGFEFGALLLAPSIILDPSNGPFGSWLKV